MKARSRPSTVKTEKREDLQNTYGTHLPPTPRGLFQEVTRGQAEGATSEKTLTDL